ncbi:MAG: hypothetical protein HC852_11010 [Acaryochloridaceae cyanobacterium RU_4_10]|nr:hypothetical protein [Acaryochloridaceae cyanobacterium RU_4_10]
MFAVSIASLMITTLAIVHFFPVRQSESTSFASRYKTMYGEKKGIPYKNLSCVSSPDKSKIDAVFLLKSIRGISPKGVPWLLEAVAITHNPPNDPLFVMQILGTRKGRCHAIYASGNEESIVPLGQYVAPEQAIEIQRTWVNFQLKNVPDYRKYTQKRLDAKVVNLTRDEYVIFKELGFTMPKKWQEVK